MVVADLPQTQSVGWGDLASLGAGARAQNARHCTGGQLAQAHINQCPHDLADHLMTKRIGPNLKTQYAGASFTGVFRPSGLGDFA